MSAKDILEKNGYSIDGNRVSITTGNIEEQVEVSNSWIEYEKWTEESLLESIEQIFSDPFRSKWRREFDTTGTLHPEGFMP